MCDILKMSGRRAYTTWTSGASIYRTKGTFVCKLFKVGLWAFGAFTIFPIFDNLVSQKWLLKGAFPIFGNLVSQKKKEKKNGKS